ncbi:hypothetical protein C427_0878 [Paraglaciecola psychrophila 170]|uniref:Uncharacterized protein n=1 Tax=Paraglaciecola psychrophila 170 TaxID=1129794 RepID=M4RX14_9ALTE|nr:hypothetical protein C427_0878 [Paraglaciecola psychrophila 170]
MDWPKDGPNNKSTNNDFTHNGHIYTESTIKTSCRELNWKSG